MKYNIIKNYIYSIPCSCGKSIQKQDMLPTKSKTRGTSKSSMLRWGQKVGYDWPYMAKKRKPSALIRWNQNNR